MQTRLPARRPAIWGSFGHFQTNPSLKLLLIRRHFILLISHIISYEIDPRTPSNLFPLICCIFPITGLCFSILNEALLVLANIIVETVRIRDYCGSQLRHFGPFQRQEVETYIDYRVHHFWKQRKTSWREAMELAKLFLFSILVVFHIFIHDNSSRIIFVLKLNLSKYLVA